MSQDKGIISSKKEFQGESEKDLSAVLRDLGLEFYSSGDRATALSAMEVASKLKPNSPFLKKRVSKIRSEIDGEISKGSSEQKERNDVPFPNLLMKTVSQDYYISAYDSFRENACKVWSDNREVYKANTCKLKDVTSKIENAYKNKKKLSVIRSGDGEGSLLYRFFPGNDNELFYLCSRGSLRLHFGPQDYKYNDLFFWANEIFSAFITSDVITSARNSEAVESLLVSDHEYDFRSMVGQIAGSLVPHDLAINNGQSIYSSGHLHRDLVPHYKELLYDKDVILIGPNGKGFADNFSSFFDCRVSDVITIPGQYIVEKGGVKYPLYPDFYQKVLLDIMNLQLRGKLCLVGAGLAGKVYCSKIASRGGVAIDVGSMMDAWAGKKARKYHTSGFLERSSLSQ